MFWEALNRKEILKKVDNALSKNASYSKGEVIGAPATYLDEKEFYPDASFLKDAPYLKTLIANPNHIGCHTLDKKSSPIFKGTQAIERELIEICSEQIFRAPTKQVDGYVATGGTEANIEAMWIYRNYFLKEYKASSDQIGVLFSEDTHYSITKGCDLLQLFPLKMAVDMSTRQVDAIKLTQLIDQAKNQGVKYFIVICNLSTTMFGSVDEIQPIVSVLDAKKLSFKLHIDAAFGGFIYPFTNPYSNHDFSNPWVSSISIDGHKMLQTPYGTGIFLIRKGYMQYVNNKNAQYVPGLDYTLCGSRSGANAIVIWMQLMNYGSQGWMQKMHELINRTDYLCRELERLNIEYFRNPFINIVTIKAKQLPSELASKYELVADSYEQFPLWWKIVVMDHVTTKILCSFINELEACTVKA